MASFSSLLTSLTGFGFYYEKTPRHATYNFNQEGQALYRNQPRFPFEYYVQINLNGAAKSHIDTFFTDGVSVLTPLIKSIEMPSMEIDTEPLDQYNRKRLSQTRINFKPVKMVFHDVCDGKTLKFWDMYYRYYFDDGNEPGTNDPKNSGDTKRPYSFEEFKKNITPKLNPNIASLPSSVKNLINGNPAGKRSATNDAGEKRKIENIVTNTLDNHHFGLNLPEILNNRNLIQSIEIFQVHGGRFNCVTLVNPRITAFNQTALDYAVSDRTMEVTLSLEYEYAFYNIQNRELGQGTSSKAFFENGETLELPALAFNARLLEFVEQNNPLLQSDNPILNRIGKNTQAQLGSVTGAFASDKVTRRVSASALDGLAKISPTPYNPTSSPPVVARNFRSAPGAPSPMYRDVNRTGGNGS